jgi:hypothetical protein
MQRPTRVILLVVGFALLAFGSFFPFEFESRTTVTPGDPETGVGKVTMTEIRPRGGGGVVTWSALGIGAAIVAFALSRRPPPKSSSPDSDPTHDGG